MGWWVGVLFCFHSPLLVPFQSLYEAFVEEGWEYSSAFTESIRSFRRGGVGYSSAFTESIRSFRRGGVGGTLLLSQSLYEAFVEEGWGGGVLFCFHRVYTKLS